MYIALYILLAVVAILFVLTLIAPKSYDVNRSVEIAKPTDEVFEYIKYLKNNDTWSPWARKDPDMQKKFTGTDGEVGAISYWNGNKDVGEGEQEITKIVQGKRIEGQLRFFKPWKSTSDCYLDVEKGANKGTKVTWGFKGNNKFPMSILMLFMSMDKMVGKDFEEGLATLKSQMES
jgi:hypothetical protein